MRSMAMSASGATAFDPVSPAYLPNVNVFPGYTPKTSGVPVLAVAGRGARGTTARHTAIVNHRIRDRTETHFALWALGPFSRRHCNGLVGLRLTATRPAA